MPERTYSEQEVAAIFARAAERHRPDSARDPIAGLTLAEIELAGREAGLDADSIRAAAADLSSGPARPTRSKIAVAERWIDAPLADGAWEDLVASLRQRFGANSMWWSKDTAAVGTAQEWTHVGASGISTTVTLSPRDGKARLRVMQESSGLEDERVMGWFIAAFIALIPAMLAGATVAETLAYGNLAGIATVLVVLLTGTALGGPFLAARTRRSRARQTLEVQDIADDLTQQLDPEQPLPTTSTSSGVPAPLLDVSVFDEPDSETESSGRRQRTTS